MYARVGFGYGLPKMVKSLLIANAAVFVFMTFLPYRAWTILFGLVPALINQKFMIWQFFTHMFLHGSFGHIFWNMFGLWMFGSELEYNWGSRDFLKYYVVCGVGGGILVWITAMLGLSSYVIPTIGASGAIFGILAAFGMMWPDRMIYIFGILPMKALHFVLIFGAIDLFQGLSGSSGNIAVFAHVGGGITGFIYLKYGWRIMVYAENYIERFKEGYRARNFTVTQGGKKSHSSGNSGTSHPDFDNEVDRILDKIARNGMESLTDKEKRILEKASGKGKK